jgi:hypothetical protein
MADGAGRPRYDLVSLIATGGMGQVWRAEDTLLHREVAVKVLKSEYAGNDLFRTRFEVEAQLAAGLQHPHVASVLDYGEREDPDGGAPRPMLVMELVEGQPLSALIGDPQLTPERAGDLVAQAGEGLAAAHRKGIVHRDVKPGNLLVTSTGQVKVTDFGIARAADAASLTLTGHLVGTPHYLSPEQAEGQRATPASDVYALGVVLFECLTGSKPFEADSPVITAMRHVRDPLPPLPDDIPERLRAVVDRACAKDPSTRFADAGEMAAALRGEVPVWPEAAATTTMPATDATRTMRLSSGPARTAAPDDDVRRRRAVRWVVAAVLLLALLVPLAWAARSLVTSGDTGSSVAPTATAARATATEGVRVDRDDYVGLPEDEARERLEAAGLVPVVERRAAVGGEETGTVAEVGPTGLVESGTEVTLTVWAPAPAATETAEPPAGDTGRADKPGKGSDKVKPAKDRDQGGKGKR